MEGHGASCYGDLGCNPGPDQVTITGVAGMASLPHARFGLDLSGIVDTNEAAEDGRLAKEARGKSEVAG